MIWQVLSFGSILDHLFVLENAALIVCSVSYIVVTLVRDRRQPTVGSIPAVPVAEQYESFTWDTPDQIRDRVPGDEVEIFAEDHAAAVSFLLENFPDVPPEIWEGRPCVRAFRTHIRI